MCSYTLLINKVRSILPLSKLFSNQNVLNHSYQDLGACFNPYNAFFLIYKCD